MGKGAPCLGLQIVDDILFMPLALILFVALLLGEILCFLAQCFSSSPWQNIDGTRRIVLFDGVCVVCNGLTNFLQKRSLKKLQFVAIQADEALTKEFLDEFDAQRPQLDERLAFIQGPKIFWGSCAVLEMLRHCAFPYPVFSFLGRCFPLFIRDPVYMLFSRNRHRWFGYMPDMVRKYNQTAL